MLGKVSLACLAISLMVTSNMYSEASSTKTTAPPAAQPTSPPAAQTTAPPAAQKTAPPAAQKTAPPATQQTAPTAAQPTAPPATQKTAPPAAQTTAPPAAQKTSPPAAQPTSPPATQTTAPPATQKTAPPAAQTTAPPAAQKTSPPAAQPTAPPATQKTAPPAAQKTSPPAAQTTAPPTAQKTAPPAAQKTAPPATQKTAPPVPKYFSYSCDINGDLTVNKTELNSYDLKVLSSSSTSSSSCIAENKTSTYGCGKNTDIVVLLERKHEKSIIGGKSREFKLYCNDSTDPYVVNVTLSAVNVTEPSSYISLPTVSPSKSTISLTMNIYDKGTNSVVTNAVIGQEMTLTIKNTGVDTIHPTQCYATHGSESYMFWSEHGCETDETLVGHQWQNQGANNSVSIALYAFHFEKSHDVGIMCSVRVCPQGYKGDLCDLTCNKAQNGKRRRRAAMAKDIHTINVRTNIHVIDTDPVTASAKGFAVNTFFVLASSLFVKLYQW